MSCHAGIRKNWKSYVQIEKIKLKNEKKSYVQIEKIKLKNTMYHVQK